MEGSLNTSNLIALKESFDSYPITPKEIQMRPDIYEKFMKENSKIIKDSRVFFNESSFNPLAGILITINKDLKIEFEIVYV